MDASALLQLAPGALTERNVDARFIKLTCADAEAPGSDIGLLFSAPVDVTAGWVSPGYGKRLPAQRLCSNIPASGVGAVLLGAQVETAWQAVVEARGDGRSVHIAAPDWTDTIALGGIDAVVDDVACRVDGDLAWMRVADGKVAQLCAWRVRHLRVGDLRLDVDTPRPCVRLKRDIDGLRWHGGGPSDVPRR